ncbi:hypothetical protein NVP1127O_56 [Vibrio phage 1.127.O._10N.286.52.E12]|nr:hypothetical protein NVP1127O_56 [Vibrio phage 1.127.O._10N.286.52.E12]
MVVRLCVIRKGDAMIDLYSLDKNTYDLLNDAAKRAGLGLYEYVYLILNNSAADEYAQQQIDDNRSAE